MNNQKLAAALRELPNRIIDENQDISQDVKDAVEVVRTMARVVLGDGIERAFGAPGDWGYDTPIGKALAERKALPEKTDQIKLCPFCGNDDPYWDSIMIDEVEEHFLMCADCGCQGPNDPAHEKAAAMWNKRV